LEVRKWKTHASSVVAKNDSLRAATSKLNIVIKEDSVKAENLSTEISKLKSSVNNRKNSADAKLNDIKLTLPDTCNEILELAEDYKTQVETLNVAIDKSEIRDSIRVHDINILKSSVLELSTQNDSLVNVIKSVPIAKQEKFLGFIPLPSRKATFVGGIMLGVATTLIISSN
jgi:hypothetical protein